MNLRQRLDEIRQLAEKATNAPREVGMRNGANGRTIFARDGERKASSDKQDVAHWDSGICDVHGLYLNMRSDEQPTGEAKSNAALLLQLAEEHDRMAKDAAQESKRLDFLTRRISGKALREAGIVWGDHSQARAAIDAAMGADNG